MYDPEGRAAIVKWSPLTRPAKLSSSDVVSPVDVAETRVCLPKPTRVPSIAPIADRRRRTLVRPAATFSSVTSTPVPALARTV
jgi:hypothetical protein